MEHASKLSRWIHQLLVPVVFILCSVMFVAVFGQVVFRYLLNKPLPWSEELARYLMVWIACLAAVEAYGTGSHVGVNALSDLLPPLPRKYLSLFVHLCVVVLMVVIFYQGFKLSYLLHDQESPALNIRMSWPYLSVPVGALLMCVQASGLFITELRLPPERVHDVCRPGELT